MLKGVLVFGIYAVLCAPACLGQEQRASACLSYGPTVVNIKGTLVRKTFAGPPNYESIRQGDEPESFWLLEPSAPVCVNEDTADPSLNPAQAQVSDIQLVLNTQAYEQYRWLLGKTVIATGTLIGARTVHHRTPVLLTVSNLESQNDLAIRKAIATALEPDVNEFCSDAKESDCREKFETGLKYTRVSLAPGGSHGFIVELCLFGLEGSHGCALRVLKQSATGYEAVLGELLGRLDDVKATKSMTNGFYDLTFSGLSYVWTGSKYVQHSTHRTMSLKVSNMESLNHEEKSTSECSHMVFGSRIKGTTPNAVQLTMSCTTTRIVCGTASDSLDKGNDGKELTCGAIFHTGQTVRFEQNENGDYRVLDFTGFDGTYEPTEHEHLKSWRIEAESVQHSSSATRLH